VKKRVKRDTFAGHLNSVTFFESKIPDFLTDRRNTSRQLIFTSLFALVFINIYSPFEVKTGLNFSQLELFFYSSLFILAGLLIIALSRIVMHQFTRKRRLSNGSYIIWITAEILSLSAVYVVLQYAFIESTVDVLQSYKESLKVTMLVLLLPYAISYLYFSWLEKNKKLEELSKESGTHKQEVPSFIPFHDEKGELRFSIRNLDMLYLEAADNYVIIHYQDAKSHEKFMIRNTLKYFENNLTEFGIIRCHRSYMVNLSKVKMVKRESDGLVLEIDSYGQQNLPISSTYAGEVLKAFQHFTLS